MCWVAMECNGVGWAGKARAGVGREELGVGGRVSGAHCLDCGLTEASTVSLWFEEPITLSCPP